MLPALRLGPFTLPTGPLALLAAFYLALEIGDRAGRRRLPKDLISNAGLVGLLAGILGARLGYILRNLSSYQLDWSQTFAMNLGTLDTAAGVFIGLGMAYAYLQRRKVNLGIALDALAPAVAMALTLLSLGNLLTGDAYGAVARGVPWSIFLWGELRHPVQIYELLIDLAIFTWLWFRAPQWFDGARFLLAVALLAGARVLIEPFRGDSVAWVAGMRSVQVVALVIMTFALTLLVRGLAAAAPNASTRE